jgi:hypothetical protein
MNMTHHANVRSQQRAISPFIIDLLLQFGKSETTGGGVAKLFFDRKARKQIAVYAGPLAGFLKEHLDSYAVVDCNMQIITVGHRTERIQRQ